MNRINEGVRFSFIITHFPLGANAVGHSSYSRGAHNGLHSFVG